jgi:hypothetical protein
MIQGIHDLYVYHVSCFYAHCREIELKMPWLSFILNPPRDMRVRLKMGYMYMALHGYALILYFSWESEGKSWI